MALRKPGDATGPETVDAEPQRTHRRDAESLLRLLDDADPAVRRWAVRDLAAAGAAMTEARVSDLGARLATEDDPGVRSALFTAIAASDSAAAVGVLLPLLRSEDAALRNDAIESLAEMPDAVARHVDALLGDADADVRIFTLNLLAQLRHPLVPGWLVRVLRDEREVNVVAAAIEVLAEVGGPDELPALSAARDRFADEPFIAFAADVARARIETP